MLGLILGFLELFKVIIAKLNNFDHDANINNKNKIKFVKRPEKLL